MKTTARELEEKIFRKECEQKDLQARLEKKIAEIQKNCDD